MQYLIGIDPGTKTGVAVWQKTTRKLLSVESMTAIAAMDKIVKLGPQAVIELRFEDARKRKWFGTKGCEALQGAGSIKRDCHLWEEFCRYHGIAFKAVPPQSGATKWSAKNFQKLTGWDKRTSEHARDAALLVYGA